MARRSNDSRHRPSAAPARLASAPPAPGTGARWSRWLAAIGFGALVLRLVYLEQLRDTPVFGILLGDARAYDAWATRIAAGDWLGTEVFYQSPLYPYFLAVIFKVVGHHLLAVRVAQAGLGAASCVLIGLAGRRFFGGRVGLIAGLLLAIYPPAIFFDGLIQKSALDLLLVTLLLACLGEFQHRPRWVWLVAAGVATGAFILNRENARVVYPVLVAWLWLAFRATSGRGRAVRTVVLTAAVAAVLLPVGWRNYHVGGEFLLSTSQLGPNFYIGNHAGAPGIYDPLLPDRGDPVVERADARRLAEAATGRRLSPGEVSDYWLSRGLAYVYSEPGAWLALMGRKLAFTLGAAEVTDTESAGAYADYSFLLRFLRWFGFGVILPLGVFGAWQTRAAWRQLSVLYSLFAGLVLSVVLFYAMARYRYPLVPIVILFGAAAVADLAGLWKESVRSRLVAGGLAVAAALSCNFFARNPDDVTYTNLGVELIAAHRPADAVPLLEKAVAAAPGYAPAYFGLGVALSQIGEKARARDQFAAAVNLRPEYVEAQQSLGSALLDAGNLSEAIDHFDAAARLKPDAADLQCDLGQALLQMGKRPQALLHLQEALRLAPDYARAHNALAGLLQQDGHLGEALVHLEEAVRLEPESLGMQMNLANLLVGVGRPRDALGHVEKALAIAQASGRADLAQGVANTVRALQAQIAK
jgi:tetratricopeptide (TPR) repeat protein